MKRTLFILFALALPCAALAQANSGWVDNKEGCWCGYQTSLVRTYKVMGQYSTVADKQAGADMLDEWNRFVTMFNVQVDPANTFGTASNGVNELNILINSTDTQSIYGFTMQASLYGRAVMFPSANFGSFNECKDFASTGCGPFTETDVVVNSGFGSGWTNDWFSDGGGSNPALIQTTTLHEVGHTLGLHHIFTLPVFGDSFSTMNYMNDDSGKFVTRMDAKTLRAQYTTRANTLTDIAIYPFTYGNGQYGETYLGLSSLTPPPQPGQTLTVSNWLVQNVGTQVASNVQVTFYLFPSSAGRQYPQVTDAPIGSVSWASISADAEQDQVGTPFVIPKFVPSGQYYLGAIATVNGAEDSTWTAGKPNNNRFVAGHGTRYPVTINNPNPAGIYLQDVDMIDTCTSGGAGHNDGVVDPGETVSLSVRVRSSLATTATGVSGTLSTTTPGVTITTPTVSFGTVAAGSSADGAAPFAFSVGSSVACGTSLAFTLTITGSAGTTTETFAMSVGTFSAGNSTTILTQAFETWPPAGWTITPTSGGMWSSSNHTGCVQGSTPADYVNNTGGSGLYADANSDCFGGAMDTVLMTPTINLSDPSYVSAQLQFKSDFRDYGNRDSGRVDISTNGGANWTNLMAYAGQSLRGPRTETLDLTSYLGQSNVKIRFWYVVPNWDWFWEVDDVVVSAGQQGPCTSHICSGSSCTLTCTATVSATGTVGTPVSFASTATATGCSGTPAYDWNYGDGTAHGATQNASHSYGTAGTFSWTLTVTQGGVTCTKTGSVTVSGGGGSKPGDCDGNGTVSIGELQRTVNMYLGTQTVGCGSDCSGDGTVSIGEIQKVVNAYLGTAGSC